MDFTFLYFNGVLLKTPMRWSRRGERPGQTSTGTLGHRVPTKPSSYPATPPPTHPCFRGGRNLSTSVLGVFEVGGGGSGRRTRVWIPVLPPFPLRLVHLSKEGGVRS